MATITSATATTLRLASPNGLIARTVLPHSPRNATPLEAPMISLKNMFSADLEQRKEVARHVRSAATTTGVFYIKDHGMPESVINNAYQASLDFFRQDMATKIKAKAPGSNNFAGYFPPKTIMINPTEGYDVKEMIITRYDPRFDPEVDDPAAIPDHIAKGFRYQDMPWDETSSVPQFKEAFIKYYQEGLKLTRALMRVFALSLDLEETYFDSKMRHPNINTNVNYYPAIEAPTGKAPSAFGSHTDFQVFTVLWQDHVGGLQVLNREGQWINIPPIPNSFVVNIADLMQRITNDVYISPVHRAQNWTGTERISMPLATGFGNHEEISVVPTCLGADGKAKYDIITVDEWVTRRLDTMIKLQKESA